MCKVPLRNVVDLKMPGSGGVASLKGGGSNIITLPYLPRVLPSTAVYKAADAEFKVPLRDVVDLKPRGPGVSQVEEKQHHPYLPYLPRVLLYREYRAPIITYYFTGGE